MSNEHSQDTPQPLLAHVLELRQRLLVSVGFFLVCFGVSYLFSQEIFDILLRPLAHAFQGQTGRRLIYTGMAEAFLTYIKVAFFCGAFFALPFLLSQIWLFIAPGLYQKERRAFFPFLVATPFLFACGAAFAYFFIMPMAWNFFLAFESTPQQTALPIQLEARVGEYLSIVMQLVLAFGISFQLPVLLVLLARVGLITSRYLGDRRRYAFVLILIASAILTPPDVLSMMGLALPLYGLFEVSILLMKGVEKKSRLPDEKNP